MKPAFLTSFIVAVSLYPLTSLAASVPSDFSLPDFYGNTPVERVSSHIVHEWPRFTFLESVLAYEDGQILVTDHNAGKLYTLRDKAMQVLVTIDGKWLCLSPMQGDAQHFMATAWLEQEGKTVGALFKVARDGSRHEQVATFPQEAFLNGITELKQGLFLMAGSMTGNIWFYNANTGESGSWYHHELTQGNHGMPGINGIKVLNDTVYFSNTGKFLVGKIAVNADGSAGAISVHAKDVLLDDFALDAAGNLYGATHKEEVIKINPKGEVSIIAQNDQGVSGSTAVAWDTSDKTTKTLLVSTNGGINHQLFGKGPSSVVPAKVVRLQLP